MENSEITLEKIELVKDRTGISYKEAKEALEKAGGSVVDAIILIEDSIDENNTKNEKFVDTAIGSIKEAIHKGNINKLTIKRGDETVLNLPVSVGIIGTVLFPWAAVASVLAAFGTRCTIELTKDDGEVVNISDKAGDAFDIAVSKGEVIANEAKEMGKDFVDFAKEKASSIYKKDNEKEDEE